MTNQPIDKKKELILKTARELLAKNGFAKTTLDDIAAALGMKKSSLYYYYTNKDALLEDVMKNEEDNFFASVSQVLNQPNTALEKIINYEKAKFEYIKNTIKLHEMSTNIILEFKGKLIQHIKNIHTKEIDLIKKILDESIKKKEIKKCDTKKVAELILTISEALRHRELYYASFTVSKSVDFSNALDEMIFALKLIFDGLKV